MNTVEAVVYCLAAAATDPTPPSCYRRWMGSERLLHGLSRGKERESKEAARPLH